MSNYKTVFFTLGMLQIILGIFMIIPIIIQLLFLGEKLLSIQDNANTTKN